MYELFFMKHKNQTWVTDLVPYECGLDDDNDTFFFVKYDKVL
jgi:hypothetical protein